MTDFLDSKLGELRDRVKELEPLHEEYLRIRQALEILEGGPGPSAPAKRGPGRPRGSKSATGSSGGGSRKRRRRRRGGTRADQAVSLLQRSPGLTVPEIAEQLSIEPNYVYRVMAELQKDGLARKDGRRYYASEAGAAAAAETSNGTAAADAPAATTEPTTPGEPRFEPSVQQDVTDA
ncbi:MAG: winged helix-turn-helix domain-containing protein [Solirubrobacterales bacterium]